jgi:hypothetical protein
MVVEPSGKREIVVFPPIPYMLRSAAAFVMSESEKAFLRKKVTESRRSLPPRKAAPIEKVSIVEISTTGRLIRHPELPGMGRGSEGRPKLTTPVLTMQRGGRTSFGKH